MLVVSVWGGEGLTPSALSGLSPKSDIVKFGCEYRVFIVGFAHRVLSKGRLDDEQCLFVRNVKKGKIMVETKSCPEI